MPGQLLSCARVEDAVRSRTDGKACCPLAHALAACLCVVLTGGWLSWRERCRSEDLEDNFAAPWQQFCNRGQSEAFAAPADQHLWRPRESYAGAVTRAPIDPLSYMCTGWDHPCTGKTSGLRRAASLQVQASRQRCQTDPRSWSRAGVCAVLPLPAPEVPKGCAAQVMQNCAQKSRL